MDIGFSLKDIIKILKKYDVKKIINLKKYMTFYIKKLNTYKFSL